MVVTSLIKESSRISDENPALHLLKVTVLGPPQIQLIKFLRLSSSDPGLLLKEAMKPSFLKRQCLATKKQCKGKRTQVS